MIGIVTLVLLTFAVARITRLIVIDEITQPWRQWVIDKFGDPDNSKISFLAHCPWCTGVWVSAPMTAITYIWPQSPTWQAILAFLAVAHVAALTADR